MVQQFVNSYITELHHLLHKLGRLQLKQVGRKRKPVGCKRKTGWEKFEAGRVYKETSQFYIKQVCWLIKQVFTTYYYKPV